MSSHVLTYSSCSLVFYRVLSCFIVFYRVRSCFIVFSRVLSCSVVFSRVLSCSHLLYPVTPVCLSTNLTNRMGIQFFKNWLITGVSIWGLLKNITLSEKTYHPRPRHSPDSGTPTLGHHASYLAHHEIMAKWSWLAAGHVHGHHRFSIWRVAISKTPTI
jgi:hypothetical protein